jgi:uncharacterized protein DUF5985
MATAVYILCFATSAACGWLLVRSYLRTRTALLLWTAICFVLLAVNNFLVVVDLVFLPDAIDLRPMRFAATLVALATLLYGFIWELD